MNHKHYLIILSFLLCLPFWVACYSGPNTETVFEEDFIRGNYAYIPFETQLLTIDIKDPLNPKVIDQVDLGSKVVEAFVDGNNLYVGRAAEIAIDDQVNQVNTEGGVFKYDITSPTPVLVDQLMFPAFVRTVSVQSDQLLVSGIENTWSIDGNRDLGSALLEQHISYSYNEFVWQDGYSLGGGGFCNFRTGHCQGWLDKLVIGEEGEILAERLYTGNVPIFAMEIVGDRLVTHGRHIMIAPLNDLYSFPLDQVEYGGGSYAGVSAGTSGDTFYFAENHEILIRQFNNESPLPTLVGRESSSPVGTFFKHMTLKGNYLYAVSSYGLHIVDVSNPETPFGAAFLPFGQDQNPAQLIPQPSLTPTS